MSLLLLQKKFQPRNIPDLQLWLDATQMGVQGYSLDFDGTDDFVQANNVITAYPFTMECWVRLDVLNSNDTLISINSTTSGNTTAHYSIRYSGTVDQKFGVRSADFISLGTITPLVNVWYHVAGVFASSTDRKLYVNGVLEASGTNSSSFDSGMTYQVRIGNLRVNTPTDFIDGKLSDVRIWNTARTAQEIADNYQKRLIGNESGLVGYWKLDRGTGTTVTDFTSNANTGTITGAIWDNSEPLTEPIDDNTAIRVWQDQSGNAYNAEQSTSAARPTYRTNQLNGLPVVRFDGTDDSLALVASALGMLRNVGGATGFAVVKYSSILVNNPTILISAASSAGSARLLLRSNTTPRFQTQSRRLDADSAVNIYSAQAVSTSSFFIHSSIANFQNTLLQQFINGAKDGENTSFGTSGNTSNTDSNNITIGLISTTYFAGDIAEIIVYNRALNTSELAQVHRYLARKWGIALA